MVASASSLPAQLAVLAHSQYVLKPFLHMIQYGNAACSWASTAIGRTICCICNEDCALQVPAPLDFTAANARPLQTGPAPGATVALADHLQTCPLTWRRRSSSAIGNVLEGNTSWPEFQHWPRWQQRFCLRQFSTWPM
jgi:hypothetical protein